MYMYFASLRYQLELTLEIFLYSYQSFEAFVLWCDRGMRVQNVNRKKQTVGVLKLYQYLFSHNDDGKNVIERFVDFASPLQM